MGKRTQEISHFSACPKLIVFGNQFLCNSGPISHFPIFLPVQKYQRLLINFFVILARSLIFRLPSHGRIFNHRFSLYFQANCSILPPKNHKFYQYFGGKCVFFGQKPWILMVFCTKKMWNLFTDKYRFQSYFRVTCYIEKIQNRPIVVVFWAHLLHQEKSKIA